MIFELMEAIDVMVEALAAWIAATVAVLMAVAAAGVWGTRAVWRGVTGAWRRKQGPEMQSGPSQGVCEGPGDGPYGAVASSGAGDVRGFIRDEFGPQAGAQAVSLPGGGGTRR